MMRIKILTIIALGVVLLGTTLPTSAAPRQDNIDTAVEIIVRINTYRQELGLPPYTYDSTLMAVAQKHTEYQVSIGLSTHKGEGDSTSSQRAAEGGYADGEFAWVNEMIYTGQYATPEKAVEWWKKSPIHNEIMTSDVYHQIGVGVAESETHIFYTVNVGSIPEVTSPGTAGVLGPDVNQVREDMTGDAPVQAVDEPAAPSAIPDDDVQDSGIGDIAPAVSVAEPTEVIENTVVDDSPAELIAEVGEQAAAVRKTDWGAVLAIGLVLLAAVGVAVVFPVRGRVSSEELEELLAEEYSDFFALPRDEQFNRLQLAAMQALEVYPLEVIRVEPLRYVLNAEFLVNAYQKGGDGELGEYVVRVNAPGFHTEAEIRSELQWLAALNKDTEIKVPAPLLTSAGDWVELVEMDLLDGPRYCVVFENLYGDTTEAHPNAADLTRIGSLVAWLHTHGSRFKIPQGFTRKHWNLEGLKGGMLDVPAEKAYAALTDEELRVVQAAEQVVAAAIQRLGEEEHAYGLIHGDLHLKNFLFDGDHPLVRDFDTCGYGYYIYDLATVLGSLFGREDFTPLRKALLNGYRRVRPLSIKEEHHLVHFIAGRLMAQTLAWAARRDDPNLGMQADRAIKRQIQKLELLIRRCGGRAFG